jgi:hypothetical protein
MPLLYLSLLAISPDPSLDYLSAKQLRLEIPSSFYTQTSSQKEWLSNLYTASLSKSKSYSERSVEDQNIYNSYLTDYYTEDDIQFLHSLVGRDSYRLTLHTRFWGGDSSGYAQGFAYSEKLQPNLTWGMGVERAEVKSDKRYNWDNNSYYKLDSWLNWQPTPNTNIYLGVGGAVAE